MISGEPPIRFEYYPENTNRGDFWRWRLVSRNGKTIADGSESYSRKSNVRRAISRFIDLMEDWAIHDVIEVVEVTK